MRTRDRSCVFGSFILSIAFAGQAMAADELFDLRGPAPKAGQVYVETSAFDIKDGKVSIERSSTIEGKIERHSASETEVEILKVDGRNAVKLRTKVVKDSSGSVVKVDGQDPIRKSETKALQGKFVINELVSNKWSHSLDGETADENQRKELKYFDCRVSDDDRYPAQWVKVGCRWNVTPQSLQRFLGARFVGAIGGGKAKFVRVETVKGEKYAVIEIDVDLQGTIEEDEGPYVFADIKGKVLTYRSLSLGIESRFTIEGTAAFERHAWVEGRTTIVTGANISALGAIQKDRIKGKFTGKGSTIIRTP
jgi:hypothetical protein